MILAIAGRELRSLFLSPLAWSLLAVTQLILAWLFLVQIDGFMQIQPRLAGMEGAPGLTDLVAMPLLGSTATLVLLLSPLLSMRLISEEYRADTFTLLLSAPVSMTRIVLGKYLGLMGFMLLILLMSAAMPLSLLAGGSLDLGKLAAGLLGLGLIMATVVAVGLFLSSLTPQPAVAAVGTYGVLLFLWIVNLTGGASGEGSVLFQWLSLASHFNVLLSGLVRISDVAYYLLLSTAFILMTIRRLDSRRTEG